LQPLYSNTTISVLLQRVSESGSDILDRIL